RLGLPPSLHLDASETCASPSPTDPRLTQHVGRDTDLTPRPVHDAFRLRVALRVAHELSPESFQIRTTRRRTKCRQLGFEVLTFLQQLQRGQGPGDLVLGIDRSEAT